jgi:hypothetical protein
VSSDTEHVSNICAVKAKIWVGVMSLVGGLGRGEDRVLEVDALLALASNQ